MSLVSALKGPGPNGFGYGSTAEQVTDGLDLTGKTFLLTGCNSGLGLETLRVLSLRGAHVLATARTVAKAQEAIEQVSANATPLACELSEPASVRQCVAAVKELGKPFDAIICNAGIMALPKLEKKHGYELQFLTNHIGHFILVTGVLDGLTDKGRVVMVSSDAHRRAGPKGIELDNLDGHAGYSAWRNYGQAKLANILFAKQLAKRLEGSARTANALHPGVIITNLTRHMNAVARVLFSGLGPLLLKSIPQGAATQCYLATHPGAETVTGEYFADCNPQRPSPQAQDEGLGEQLWEASERIVREL